MSGYARLVYTQDGGESESSILIGRLELSINGCGKVNRVYSRGAGHSVENEANCCKENSSHGGKHEKVCENFDKTLFCTAWYK